MVDVCFLVEGAYPYVAGGVSSWLHALMTNLPDITFSVVSLSSTPDPDRKPKYAKPANVAEFREIYIHDPQALQGKAKEHRGAPVWETLRAAHAQFAVGQWAHTPEMEAWLSHPKMQGFSATDLFAAKQSWEMLVERYQQRAPEASFVDFFWTFRFTHAPLFTLLEAELPPARVYHAVSTGFSGVLGALANLRTGRPFMLTEHGIYVREREIEIAQADWIYIQQQNDFHLGRRLDFFQEWWVNLFRYMTKFAYDQASAIISITSANQRYQLRDGADPARMLIIPNGIDTHKLSGLRRSTPLAQAQFTLGFVGRIVSIKDVKTLIRAIKIASAVIPNLVAYLIGPTDEEPEYHAECVALTQRLGLSDIIRFTGQADVKLYYRQIDVLVLTSLSEGQPLVILEGNCAGVPVVATDVGACRELLMGSSAEDQALGPSGLLTPAASPEETANALIRLWREPELRARLGQAGQARVERYYRQDSLYHAYRTLYQRYMGRPDAVKE